MKNITKTTLKIGLEKPVRLLHITDVHLTRADSEDPALFHDFMKERKNTFQVEGCKAPAEYFKEAIALSEEKGWLLINTGDTIDLNTHGCLTEFRTISAGHDMMFTPGGHEHQKQFVRTMEEPDGYYKDIRKKLVKDFEGYDLDISSRVIGGLNVVCADNSLDYFNRATVDGFKKELEKGLPTVVFMHDPIWDALLMKKEPYHENVMLTAEDYRISHEMIDLLLHHPLVIATFGGHLHNEQSMLIDGKTHYCTAGLFKGACRYIEVK